MGKIATELVATIKVDVQQIDPTQRETVKLVEMSINAQRLSKCRDVLNDAVSTIIAIHNREYSEIHANSLNGLKEARSRLDNEILNLLGVFMVNDYLKTE